MPYYQYLRSIPATDRLRACDGLLRLKTALAEQVPEKTTAGNLLIATWNIREFDSSRYGKRMEEAIYYIAEIIDHFDLVAIQEVNEDLDGVDRVRRVLGSAWRVMFSDVTEGSSGNKERLAFLYDSRKLSFTGLSGEIVIPPLEVPDETGKKVYQPSSQLARTPSIVGLRTSWFSFMISTVHILYGKQASEDPNRVEEVRLLSDFLARRADNVHAHSNNLILLGDFNIYRPGNKTFNEIVRNFHIPPALQNLPSNVSQNKYYDQIAFRGYVPDEFIKGGIFNYFKYVYRPEDEAAYAPFMPDTYHEKDDPDDKARYYEIYWRTHQMSDHLPMWIELKIDFSVSYLNNLKADIPIPEPPDGDPDE
jgi:exonuclease III